MTPEEIIAKKIVDQCEGTLALLFGEEIKVTYRKLYVPIHPEVVINAVQKITGFMVHELRGKKGSAVKSLSKHLLMYYLHNRAGISKREISAILQIDRATVLAGIRKIEGFIDVADSVTIDYITRLECVL